MCAIQAGLGTSRNVEDGIGTVKFKMWVLEKSGKTREKSMEMQDSV